MPHKDPAARKAYLQRWAEQNREKCREAQKRHYQKLKAAGEKRPWEARNPDKVRAMKREQARRKYKPSGRVVQTPEQRAEKARVAARDYRRRNREKVDASCKAWRSAHPEKAKAIRRRWETKAIAARRERSRGRRSYQVRLASHRSGLHRLLRLLREVAATTDHGPCGAAETWRCARRSERGSGVPSMQL
jgi:hypothetical protein